MSKIMQMIYLRPLFNQLRQRLDVILPALVKSGLFTDTETVSFCHNIKKGKAYWATNNCEIELILKEDRIETYVRANSSGAHNLYMQLIYAALQRKLCRYSDGGLHTIQLDEAERASAFSLKLKCEEVTRRFVELNTVIKETAVERKAIYDAFLEMDKSLLKPFIKKINPSFIPQYR